MTKPNFLSAALMAAALLTTPAMARQGQPTSQRLTANARITMNAHGTDGQTRFRSRAGDLRVPVDRDAWGHCGAYYGPMVVAP